MTRVGSFDSRGNCLQGDDWSMRRTDAFCWVEQVRAVMDRRPRNHRGRNFSGNLLIARLPLGTSDREWRWVQWRMVPLPLSPPTRRKRRRSRLGQCRALVTISARDSSNFRLVTKGSPRRVLTVTPRSARLWDLTDSPVATRDDAEFRRVQSNGPDHSRNTEGTVDAVQHFPVRSGCQTI